MEKLFALDHGEGTLDIQGLGEIEYGTVGRSGLGRLWRADMARLLSHGKEGSHRHTASVPLGACVCAKTPLGLGSHLSPGTDQGGIWTSSAFLPSPEWSRDTKDDANPPPRVCWQEAPVGKVKYCLRHNRSSSHLHFVISYLLKVPWKKEDVEEGEQVETSVLTIRTTHAGLFRRFSVVHHVAPGRVSDIQSTLLSSSTLLHSWECNGWWGWSSEKRNACQLTGCLLSS